MKEYFAFWPEALAAQLDPGCIVPVAEGCSQAQVWQVFHRPTRQTAFLRILPERQGTALAQESSVYAWLLDRLPVPRVLFYHQENGTGYLLLSAIPGQTAAETWHSPLQLAERLADGLRQIHQIDIRHCPFEQRLEHQIPLIRRRIELGLVDESDFEDQYLGQSAEALLALLLKKRPADEDLVFTHGDYCLPNILLDRGRISGFIDMGQAGLADRWRDLALGARSLVHNGYDQTAVRHFLACYGAPVDQAKLEFYTLLDEFF